MKELLSRDVVIIVGERLAEKPRKREAGWRRSRYDFEA
jgi:hypothetical protein